MKRYCIAFAGPIGSGKSPIANYLGINLGLPIFNKDTLRTEALEDGIAVPSEAFENRYLSRLNALVNTGKSFIYDASIDRVWQDFEKTLTKLGYKVFIISLDFSKAKLIEIWNYKKYTEFNHLERTIKDHKIFIKMFGNSVNFSLKDVDFPDRLEKSLNAVKSRIASGTK